MSGYFQWSGSTPLLWDDLRFPAQGINPIGPTSPPDTEADTGMLLFTPNSTDLVAGVAQMPHSWKEGSTIHPHIHWNAAAAGAGNVLWRLEYSWVADEGSFTGTYATTLNNLVASPGDGVLMISNFPLNDSGVAGTGLLISSLFFWRLSRVGGDASDTFAGNARLVEFDIHYQLNSEGSRALYAK